jgi:DHA1 family bicyclomycin/chloramphenicol resistance-like MFS transporter
MTIMGEALNASVAQMHLSLSAYLLGYASFHLLSGPLADSYGRKTLLLAGFGLYVLGSLGCAQSESIESLIGFRVMQGVGGCVGPTLARTIARDVYGPVDAARAMSLVAMMMAVAPAIAPLVGGFVLLVWEWPFIFYTLAVYGVINCLLIFYLLRETLPVKHAFRPKVILANYAELIKHPQFLWITGGASLNYAALMIFLPSAPFVFVTLMGLKTQHLAFVFVATVSGYMTGSAISARASYRFDSPQILLAGACLSVVATIGMSIGYWLAPMTVAAVAGPMVLYSTSLGLVQPHAMALALKPFGHIAGTGSSLLGFIQMSTSALASAFVGQFLLDSAWPMLAGMLGLTASALLTLFLADKTVRGSSGFDRKRAERAPRD